MATYSIDEQYDLAFARSDELANQLEFSFRLERDRVAFDQEIFFTATFTNATDFPLVLREPRQHGVIEQEYPDTTLLFSVQSIDEGASVRYPFQGLIEVILEKPTREEFVTLPAHGSREIRLRLPHMAGSLQEMFPLSPGQYLVHMTYMNYRIGYRVEQNREARYADINAWVGEAEASPVLLTITPEE